MISLIPWVLGLAVLVASGLGLWAIFRVRSSSSGDDSYLEALEFWIDSDLVAAEKLLRKAVQEDPDSIDPFLQLGNLLRAQGDPERAAILHRGLTVRGDLPRSKRILVGLALAEDLLALDRFDDAKQTLDTISSQALGHRRYWKSRFHQHYGMGNLPEAARSLKHSLKQVPVPDRPWFTAAYISFQLDRAMESALAGDHAAVGPRLKDVTRFPEARPRINLVRALMAATSGDATGALALGAEGLLDSPRELAVFLPVLQNVLLESGQYARSIPLLENACQAENAPASLWVDLALLYEKLDQRDSTLRLLESKSGRSDFTPNVAAPILRHLFSEGPDTDARKVWDMLSIPPREHLWICSSCEVLSDRIRWFCPQCLDFDSYVPHATPGEVS
ncbi:MAG: hypothetical protein KOO60_02935 [Gemmatimonadales bacterium]|nr:hypothetical protein [Gemmatimonadales bacterium]